MATVARSPASVGDDVTAVAASADTWAHLDPAGRIDLLKDVVRRTAIVAPAWVDAAVLAKGIAPRSPLVGEEWISGPWALIAGAKGCAETMRSWADNRVPVAGLRTRRTCSGQVAVRVLPRSVEDRILLNSITADIWMQPDVDVDTLDRHCTAPEPSSAAPSRSSSARGTSPPSHPWTSYPRPSPPDRCRSQAEPGQRLPRTVLKDIFAAWIAEGFLRIATGGNDTAAALIDHPLVDRVHLTGNAATHQAIVFPGGRGAARRA